MSLFTRITSIILFVLIVLMFAFGWFSVMDEKEVLEGLLAKHGNALAKVVSDFSVDLLLLEDYPVLETVIGSFVQREDNVLSIEIIHNEKTVASYHSASTETGILFVAPVELHDSQSGMQSNLGIVRLRLSQVDNQNIIMARQREILLHTAVAFLVLLLIMSLILRKTILKRIDDLTQRIDTVSSEIGIHADAKLTHGATDISKDELDFLSKRFDEMVSSVRQHNEALQQEVTRRTIDLQKAKDSAERSNVAKSRFLAAASHDLRQPLQALSLYAGVLEIRISDADLVPVVRNIGSGIQVMRDMLNTLLDVSRLDAGVIIPEVRQFAIAEILAELDTDFRKLAHDKGIALSICNSSLQTESDPILLGRILRNLVSNAVHYTEHGKILVGCRRSVAVFRVDVYDTGIGISADQLGEIFEDFHQVGNVARNRRLGLGLGLAIAKGMADLLGHRLYVSSLPGKGSCFSIELPLIITMHPADEKERLPQPLKSQQHYILVIDDEQDILDSLKALLEVYGYQVITALSEHDAVQHLQELAQRPDIIIADYRLSEGKNGNDAIIAVGKACGAAIPGILLTGDTDPERIVSASHSGFSLLHKPMDPAVLVATIQELLVKGGGDQSP
jgi:signal transduction histidine kinase/ActR/RegA family two-component response regulator